jgi:hypothetical protein
MDSNVLFPSFVSQNQIGHFAFLSLFFFFFFISGSCKNLHCFLTKRKEKMKIIYLPTMWFFIFPVHILHHDILQYRW